MASNNNGNSGLLGTNIQLNNMGNNGHTKHAGKHIQLNNNGKYGLINTWNNSEGSLSMTQRNNIILVHSSKGPLSIQT